MKSRTTCLFLLFFLTKLTFSLHTQRDALQDNLDDAEAYAQYMAATEASAPLIRSQSEKTWVATTYLHPPKALNADQSIMSVHNQLLVHRTSSMSENTQVLSNGQSTNLNRKTLHQPDSLLSSGASATISSSVTHFHRSYAYPFPRPVVHVWSAWSSWSKCSRSCGGGVMSRHRTCRREYARISANSGIRSSYQRCLGDPVDYALCNTQTCPSGAKDFRQYQCALYNNRTIMGHTVTNWVPYRGGSNPCELSCLAEGKGFFYTFGKVLDGTKCAMDAQDSNPDYCVNGRCLAVGCDGKVGSLTKVDMCGICGGQNATCAKIAAVVLMDFPSSAKLSTDVNKYNKLIAYGYNAVVRIPRGATHVKISENSTNYLAMMDDKRRYVLNGNWIIDWPGRYEAGGTVFDYSRAADNSEVITANGPLQEEVIVMVLVRDANPGIYYEYWIPKTTSPPKLPANIGSLGSHMGVLPRSTPPPTLTAAPLRTTTALTVPTTSTTTRPVVANPDARQRYFYNSSASNPERGLRNLTKNALEIEEEIPEPQPTAASLVRGVPRYSSQRNVFAWPYLPKEKPVTITTSTPMSTSSTPTTPHHRTTNRQKVTKPKKLKTVKKKKKSSAAKVSKMKKVQYHMGVFKKDHGKPPCHNACGKAVNGKRHFCLSDFVLRCQVLNYETIGGEIRYEVQVTQSYKNMIPILSREFIWVNSNEECDCSILKLNHEYIIMGKADKEFRKNEARLLIDRDSYIRTYSKLNVERVLRIRREEARYCHKYKLL